jgi:hypothetical protein
MTALVGLLGACLLVLFPARASDRGDVIRQLELEIG